MSAFDDINQATDLPVASTVSPSLHPNMLLEPGRILAADDSPKTAQAYENARRAQGTLYQVMGAIEAAHETAHEQYCERLVVDGKRIRGEMSDKHKQQLIDDMSAAFESAARKFDSHLGILTEAQAKLTEHITKALEPTKRDAFAAQTASDLRKVVAAQKDPMGFLHGALQEKDFAVVQAVLSAESPRASGLSAEQFATLRVMAAQAFAPREFDQLGAINKTVEALQRSAHVAVARYQKLLPVIRPTAANVARQKLKEAANA